MAGSFNAVFFLFAYAGIVRSAKLNAPQILLPYSGTVVSNFTLKVVVSADEAEYDQCYTWKSTNPDVVAIHLVNSTDDECSTVAIVSAVSKTNHRMTSIILAENRVTREVLQCFVIVDTIAEIAISTTTRVLSLDDTPELLVILAFDSEKNVFSCLNGIVFDWKFLDDKTVKANYMENQEILLFLRFKESSYETPLHIIALEERGLWGDTVLVECLKTGTVTVEARLADPVYKDVKSATVGLIAIANLMVNPPNAYLLQFGTVKYRVEQLRHKTLKAIPLPSPQYLLEVNDKDICFFDKATSVATALKIGSTEIVLTDRNIQTTEQFHQPSAILHVVNAASLSFVILPHKKWVLEVNQEYDVYMEIYDSDGHKIHCSDNLVINSFFPTEYFMVLSSLKNGTAHRVKTLQKGETKIEGALVGIYVDNRKQLLDQVVRHEQPVEIYGPISVVPQELFFPWDPAIKQGHRCSLKASGGSGEFTWSSRNATIASVNSKGAVNPVGPGMGTIVAADIKNQKHTGTAKVIVSLPTDIALLPVLVETEVSANLELPLAMYSVEKGVKHSFHDCRRLLLNVTFSDSTVFEYMNAFPDDSAIVGEACSVITIRAKQPGTTKVFVSYKINQAHLETHLAVAAYKPLKSLDPESVVALGSSKDIVFEGGPQPWVLDPSGYFEMLTSEWSSLVIISQLSVADYSIHRGLHAFTVVCKDLGDQMLTIEVGNSPSVSNRIPAVVKAFVRFTCATPVGLHLQPHVQTGAIHHSNLPPCPVLVESNHFVPVHCKRDLNIMVTVTDDQGRKFDNFSSLYFEWNLSNTSLASIPLGSGEMRMETVQKEKEEKVTTGVQTVMMQSEPGLLVITASCSRYITRHLWRYSISLESRLRSKISRSLELKLVEDPWVSPENLSIFNHPSNAALLKIHEGSGYFHVEAKQSQIVDVEFDCKKKTIKVIPRKDGDTAITVYDLCLRLPQHPSSTVQVSGVGRINLSLLDKVEVGKHIQAKVHILDANGEPLLAKYFHLMNLTVSTTSDIIMVRPSKEGENDSTVATYNLQGVHIGHTSLTSSAWLQSGNVVLSKTKNVEVFPHLHLQPRNVTVIVGALFQVLSYGGPRPQSTVVFTIDKEKIATVSGSGLLDAQEVGTATLIGQAIGNHPDTNEPVMYSEDLVKVHVVKLAGVRIHAPLTRLQVGTQMSMCAFGLTDQETPFTFGSGIPPLAFSWTVSNKKVAVLQSVYHKSGLEFNSSRNFATQFTALEAGTVTVHLQVKVTVRGKKQVEEDDKLLQDSLQIEVFDKLLLVVPSSVDGCVMITPSTETSIRTNRDGAAQLIYQIFSNSDYPSVATIDNTGRLVSSASPGEATLVVTSLEDFGINQTVVVEIKVKPVSYLMINADTLFQTAEGSLNSIPLGSTLRFSVTFHDEVGRIFHATNIRTECRCSRYDLLQVSSGLLNNTFVAKATNIGQTILKVWNADLPRMADYINIPVSKVISPVHSEVMLGDILCFHIPLVSDKGYKGEWSSSSKAIQVEAESGIGIATFVGHTHVIYNIAELTTMTEILVKPVEIVITKSLTDSLTNVPSRSSGMYTITVGLGHQSNIIGGGCSTALRSKPEVVKPLLFHCELELSARLQDISIMDLFTITPAFDPTLDTYVCHIYQVRNSHLLQQVSTVVTDIIVYISVQAQENQPEITASPILLPFYPAFYVHTTELFLSTASSKANVRVSTISKLVPHIKVMVSDSSIIKVLPTEVDAISAAVLYPLQLNNVERMWEHEKLDISVIVSCKLTSQSTKVPIYVKLVGSKADYNAGINISKKSADGVNLSENTLYQWIIIVLLVVAAILVAIIVYFAQFGTYYQMSQLNQSSFLSPDGASQPYINASGAAPSIGNPCYVSPGTRLWSVRGSGSPDGGSMRYRRFMQNRSST